MKESEVKEIWRMYKRGKWYHSDTAAPGYEKYYYATNVRITLYYRDKERAQRDADKHNKRIGAYKKGLMRRGLKAGKIPDVVTWDDMRGTELHDPFNWFHDSGTWLNAHGYDDFDMEELLKENVKFIYSDGHSNEDFFDLVKIVFLSEDD